MMGEARVARARVGGVGSRVTRTSGNRSGFRQLRVLDVMPAGESVKLVERSIVVERPDSVAALTTTPGALAMMVWDTEFPLPAAARVTQLLSGPCHVWHAGLRLGQADRPAAWNLCHGRAMFSCDVDASIESTSWKISLRSLIVRNEVIETFGGFDPTFETPSGAALDAGLRWISRGALMRHIPDLLPARSVAPPDAPPSPVDGILLVRRHLGTKWALWAAVRGLRSGAMPPRFLPRALTALGRGSYTSVLSGSRADGLPAPEADLPDPEARVSVLVPTVGRYDYLEDLLVQLGVQTRRPHQVVVVDQNPVEERRDLTAVAPDLPLQVLHLLPPGQCTARNTGLRAVTGTHVLFLDDDDEIPPDLIEQHLRVLASPEVAVSCGLIDDRESGPAPASERFRKASGVFPTNNAMIRLHVLEATGLFDPTYDRGARADHDLGMRSYLAGNLHVHDPRPRVFHHHAPMGGLRTHGARVRTRGNSRSTLTKRHLRTPTDVYLGLRYYSPDRVDDDLALSVFATFGGSGPWTRRLMRVVVQLALLPANRAASAAARIEGERLYLERPELPTLRVPNA